MEVWKETWSQSEVLECLATEPPGKCPFSGRLPRPSELRTWLADWGAEYPHETWLTDAYVAFPKERGGEIGESIVWMEGGLEYRFEVPGVVTEDGVDLRTARGILIFRLSDIRYDAWKRLVKVKEGRAKSGKLARFEKIDTVLVTLDHEGTEGIGDPCPTLPSGLDWKPGSTGWHGLVVINTLDILREAGDPVRRDAELRHSWTEQFRVATL